MSVGDEAAAVLFDVTERQACGFVLESAEAEAGCARLGDDEAAVLEKQLACLGKSVCRGVRVDLPEGNGARSGFLLGHIRF